ncbi:hypothetical protein ABT215_44570 [Streptomyces sp900105755]|uniref:hypothetical protein n=1 Tax=Streptomyces sp. 900105755 TaxID=3154389 RepID=UPI003331A0BB
MSIEGGQDSGVRKIMFADLSAPLGGFGLIEHDGDRMRNMRSAKRLAIVAATIALAGMAAMQPASAVQRYASQNWDGSGAQAELDTAPGDGAQSWVWVYQPSGQGVFKGSVDYMYADGSWDSLLVDAGQAAAADVSTPVIGIRACSYMSEEPQDGGPWWHCGDWSWA